MVGIESMPNYLVTKGYLKDSLICLDLFSAKNKTEKLFWLS